MSVDVLIELLKKKDEKGLSHLYDCYSPALFGIIVRIVPTEKLAEEILQETFLKIWNKIDLYDSSKSTFFTWMSQIARNSAIDQRRLKRFDNLQKTDSLDMVVYSNIADVPANHSPIDAENLLNSLEEKYRQVLDCVYLKGYSHTQAADVLDLPLGTVKTRLRQGLIKLRELVKDEK